MYTKEQIAKFLFQFLHVGIDPNILCDQCVAKFEKEIGEFKQMHPECDLDDETTWTQDCVDSLTFYLTEVLDFVNDMQTQNSMSAANESRIIGAPIYITRGGYSQLLGKYLPSGTVTKEPTDDEVEQFNNSFKSFLKENPGVDPMKGAMTDQQMVDLVKIIKESRRIVESKGGIGELIDKVSSGKMKPEDIESEIDKADFPEAVKQALKYAKTAKDKYEVVHDFWAEGLIEEGQDEESIREGLITKISESIKRKKLLSKPTVLTGIIGRSVPLGRINESNIKEFLAKFTSGKLSQINEGVELEPEVVTSEAKIPVDGIDGIAYFDDIPEEVQNVIKSCDKILYTESSKAGKGTIGGSGKNGIKFAANASIIGVGYAQYVLTDFGGKMDGKNILWKGGKEKATVTPEPSESKINEELIEDFYNIAKKHNLPELSPLDKRNKQFKFTDTDGQDEYNMVLRYDVDSKLFVLDDGKGNDDEIDIDSFKQYVGESRVDENKILKAYKIYVTPDKSDVLIGQELAKKINGQYSGSGMERKKNQESTLEGDCYHLVTSYLKKSEVKDLISDSFQLVEESKINSKREAIAFKTKISKINEAKDSVEVPGSNLIIYGFGRDTNGNPIINLGFPNQRGFSIQVNGTETGQTWKLSKGNPKAGELSDDEIMTIGKEVVKYIKDFGSKQQKQSLKIFNSAKDTFESKEDDLGWGELDYNERYSLASEAGLDAEKIAKKKFKQLTPEEIKAMNPYGSNESIKESKWQVTGGPLGKPYMVEASSEAEAKQKAVSALKSIFNVTEDALTATNMSKMLEHHLEVGEKVEIIAGEFMGSKGEITATSEDGLSYTVLTDAGEVTVGDTEVQKDQELNEAKVDIECKAKNGQLMFYGLPKEVGNKLKAKYGDSYNEYDTAIELPSLKTPEINIECVYNGKTLRFYTLPSVVSKALTAHLGDGYEVNDEDIILEDVNDIENETLESHYYGDGTPILQSSELKKGQKYEWTSGAEAMDVTYVGPADENPDKKAATALGRGFLFQFDDGKYVEVSFKAIKDKAIVHKPVSEEKVEEASGALSVDAAYKLLTKATDGKEKSLNGASIMFGVDRPYADAEILKESGVKYTLGRNSNYGYPDSENDWKMLLRKLPELTNLNGIFLDMVDENKVTGAANNEENPNDEKTCERYANVTDILESEECDDVNSLGAAIVLDNTDDLASLMTDIREGASQAGYDSAEVICVEDDLYNKSTSGIRYVVYMNPEQMPMLKSFLEEKGYKLDENPLSDYLEVNEGQELGLDGAARTFITKFVNGELKVGDTDSPRRPNFEVVEEDKNLVLRSFGVTFKAILNGKNIKLSEAKGNISKSYANAITKDAELAGIKIGILEEGINESRQFKLSGADPRGTCINILDPDGEIILDLTEVPEEELAAYTSGADDIDGIKDLLIAKGLMTDEDTIIIQESTEDESDKMYSKLSDLALVDGYENIDDQVVSSSEALDIIGLADSLNSANKKQLLTMPMTKMVEISQLYKNRAISIKEAKQILAGK